MQILKPQPLQIVSTQPHPLNPQPQWTMSTHPNPLKPVQTILNAVNQYNLCAVFQEPV